VKSFAQGDSFERKPGSRVLSAGTKPEMVAQVEALASLGA